jgi:hypothetical protein
MPDLTIVHMQQCCNQRCSSAKWPLGCWPWRKSRNCKHVCGWHEQSGERQTKEGVCPRCGDKTETVRVGV